MSAIQQATGLHWRTMRRYRDWAATQGLLDQPLPLVEVLHQLMATTLELPPPPQTVSSVEPYRELVTALYAQGVACTAIWQRLRERGYGGSLSCLYRFVHRLEPHAHPRRCAWNASLAAKPQSTLALRAAWSIPSLGRSARLGPL